MGAIAIAVAAVAAPAPAATAAPVRVRAQIRVIPQEVGTPHELFGVSFPDTAHGHVVGTVGTVLATTDGGTTWTPQTAPVAPPEDGQDEVVNAVSFPDPLHGHAVGSNGSLLATSDGGATWTVQPNPPLVDLDGKAVGWTFRDVSFSDPDTGLVIGGRGSILATTDAGASWRVFANPGFGNLMGVASIDKSTGHAVGWTGQVAGGVPFVTVATGDGGTTWDPQPADFGADVSAINFNAVSFPDRLHGFVVGDAGRIVATTDGGHTWTLQRGGAAENLTGVAFADARRGVVVATVTLTTGVQRALVFATDDGGLTWVSRFAPDTVRLRGGVDFADHSTAYAVGCRRDGPGGGPGEPTCQDGALVKIAFFDQPAPASDSGGNGAWMVWVFVAVGLAAGLVIGVVVARRRVMPR